MTWHGQINRTIWEIQKLVENEPKNQRFRRELLRAHFLQHFEFDKAFHVPRDDRSFLFLQEEEAPACLMIHGAQGTPAELRELGNYLYQRGFSVYCPRLSRLDTKERMVSWESWATQSETALETVMTYSRVVFVVGMSLGGTIALMLGKTKGLKGLVLLAPAIYPRRNIKTRLYEIGRFLTPTLFYRLAGWNGEVTKAMDHARRKIKRISCPTLTLQAADDQTLSHRGLKFVRRHCRARSSDSRLLPHGSHALTRGEAKDDVFERVLGFLEKQSKRHTKNGGGEDKSDTADKDSD